MQNKFAACDWIFPVGGAMAVELAGKIGYTGIQIGDQGGLAQNFPLTHPAVQDIFLGAAERCGVELIMLNMNSVIRDNRILYPAGTRQSDEIILTFKNDIDAAAAMGIQDLFIGSFFSSAIQTEADMRCYAAHLRYAALYAADKGLRVNFESVLTVEQLDRMMDMIGIQLPILYDSCNPLLHHTTNPPDDILQLGKDRICDQFHLKNICGDRNTEQTRRSPAAAILIDWCELEKGWFDIPACAKALKEIGWNGWIVNENFHNITTHDIQKVVELFQKDLDFMQRAFHW